MVNIERMTIVAKRWTEKKAGRIETAGKPDDGNGMAASVEAGVVTDKRQGYLHCRFSCGTALPVGTKIHRHFESQYRQTAVRGLGFHRDRQK